MVCDVQGAEGQVGVSGGESAFASDQEFRDCICAPSGSLIQKLGKVVVFLSLSFPPLCMRA